MGESLDSFDHVQILMMHSMATVSMYMYANPMAEKVVYYRAFLECSTDGWINGQGYQLTLMPHSLESLESNHERVHDWIIREARQTLICCFSTAI